MESTTVEKLKFELVEGEFTPREVEELIVNFLDRKINLHKLRNLAHHEGNCKPDQHSLTRIKELEESKQLLMETIQRAKSQRLTLSIHSKISIELV